jgi:predicted nuclease of predicted toxin-antitoxin system
MPQLKFLVDACVDVRLTRWLRNQGHDARHLRDEGLQKLPDETIFAKAITEGCVVITHDLDFGEIAALTHGHKASVIVFRLHNPRIARLTERLSEILPGCVTALRDGAVVIVEDSRHRVRTLPIGAKQ